MVAVILIVSVLPLPVRASPLTSNTISGNVTWNTDRTITSDVVIAKGAKLTIKAITVTAQRPDNKPSPKGASPEIEIIVDTGGTLIVEPGAKLTAPGIGDWQGIYFRANSNGEVRGATINNGRIGINILSSSPMIQDSIIQYMFGRNGLSNAHDAGQGVGIQIEGNSESLIKNNRIMSIHGGHGYQGASGDNGTVANGGNGQTGERGGYGGRGYGIYVYSATDPLTKAPKIEGNTIIGISGGDAGEAGEGGDGIFGYTAAPNGGNGGDGGHGSSGGDAHGIHVVNAANGVRILDNTVKDITGGNGGNGGDGGSGGAALDGYESHVNAGNGGNGGSGGIGGYGGEVYAIKVTSSKSTILRNTVNGTVTGGAGGNGGDATSGADGGSGGTPAAGSGDMGGDGGNGGNGGTGGDGGPAFKAFGIYADNDGSSTISLNTLRAKISSGPGARGGSGGDGGIGGIGGTGADHSTSLGGNGGEGGDGGNGGNGGNGSYSGTTSGLSAKIGDATISRNYVKNVQGNIGGAGQNGGLGGNGADGGDGGQGVDILSQGDGGSGGFGGNGGHGGAGGNSSYVSGLVGAPHSDINNNIVSSIVAKLAGSGGDGGGGGDGGNSGFGPVTGFSGSGGDGGNGGSSGGNGYSAGFIVADNSIFQFNSGAAPSVAPDTTAGGSGGPGGSGWFPGLDGSAGPDGTGAHAYGLNIPLGNPIIVNNIIAFPQPVAAASFDLYGIGADFNTPSQTLDYNIVHGWFDLYHNVTKGAHDMDVDPLFVDLDNGDLHIKANSPAVNAAQSTIAGVTVPNYDYDGEARPQGNGYDIGADEFFVCIPVKGATIAGPVTGEIGKDYTFTAAPKPTNASRPIMYTWGPTPDSGQGASRVTYAWDTPGDKEFGINSVSNCGGQVSGPDHHITIGSAIYLPNIQANKRK